MTTRNYLVIDTETTNLVNYKDNQAHPESALVYDLGYVIYDAKGNVLNERSFIISETFFMNDRMNSAYYAEKLPQYRNGAGLDGSKDWNVDSFLNVWNTFKNDCKLYNVHKIWAFNVNFDKTALNHTLRYLSNGYARYFFPYNIKACDIWDYAENVTATNKYVNYCIDNNYLTAKGNPITNAETVYRYLKTEQTFEEKHTAVQDCYIEGYILNRLRKRHAKQPMTAGQGWRKAASKAQALRNK